MRADDSQRVVVVAPAARDVALSDALHRLQAELQLQHFETVPARARAARDPAQSLRALAQKHKALAAIALRRSGGSVAFEIWLQDLATGGGSLHPLSSERSSDAALLAVRAVDLLRASLGEPASGSNGPAPPPEPAPSSEAKRTDVSAVQTGASNAMATQATAAGAPVDNGVQPRATAEIGSDAHTPASAAQRETSATQARRVAPQAKPVAEQTADESPDEEEEPDAPDESNRRSAAEPRAWLQGEGQLSRAGKRFGFAYGPSLGFFYRALPWFELGAVVVAPLLGARVTTDNGPATLWQASAWLETRLSLLRMSGVRVSALLGLGAYFVQAQGMPNPPLLAQRASVAASCGSLGARVEYALTTHLALAISARARALYPRLGVKVSDMAVTIELPLFEAALGLALGF